MVLSNENILKFLYKIPYIKYFFVININKLENITDKNVIHMLYRLFYTNDGPTKQTIAGRFDDIDQIALKYMDDQYNIIHDIGVSSGITSIELYKKLELHKMHSEFYISDKFSRFTVSNNKICKIYDSNNQLTFGYVSIFLASDKIRYFFISKLLFKIISKLSDNKMNMSQIILYDHEVKNLIYKQKIIDIEYDVFSSRISEKFTFIRCMNLLNLGYFNKRKIVDAINTIKNSLKEDGVLLIGRTLPNNMNKASFFKKKHNQLNLVEDINGGAEIKDLILGS